MSAVAAAVSRRSDLVLDGATLTIKLLSARTPHPASRGTVEVDPRTLLFKSLTPLVGELDPARLREFAAKAGGARVERVEFMPRPGTALVHYKEDLGEAEFRNVRAMTKLFWKYSTS